MSENPVERTKGVRIWRCNGCGASVFPEPLLCPKCHGASFRDDHVAEATVEEISVIRHMLGQENWKPRRIASVCTSEGLRFTVGLADDSKEGSVVALYQEREAPFGQARR